MLEFLLKSGQLVLEEDFLLLVVFNLLSKGAELVLEGLLLYFEFGMSHCVLGVFLFLLSYFLIQVIYLPLHLANSVLITLIIPHYIQIILIHFHDLYFQLIILQYLILVFFINLPRFSLLLI